MLVPPFSRAHWSPDKPFELALLSCLAGEGADPGSKSGGGGVRCATAPTGTLAGFEAIEIGLIEHVARIAELAGHCRDAVFAHIVEFVRRERAQDSFDTFARAAATRFQCMRVVDPDPFLVEQPV